MRSGRAPQTDMGGVFCLRPARLQIAVPTASVSGRRVPNGKDRNCGFALSVTKPPRASWEGSGRVGSGIRWPIVSRHHPLHEAVEERDCEGCIPVTGAIDHTLQDEAVT